MVDELAVHTIFGAIMHKTCKVDDQISAFADGELALRLHEPLMKSFQDPLVLRTWRDYHTIGEHLRSNDAGHEPSINFSRQLAAQLKDEPAHLKSETGFVDPLLTMSASDEQRPGWMHRVTVPGLAVAATAIFALPIGLEMLNASNNSTSAPNTIPAVVQLPSTTLAMQNAQFDHYLLAHQRFSPSIYTTAHYARFASSEND